MTLSADCLVRADGSVLLNSGQVLSTTHAGSQCMGPHCVIHNPSDHELRGEQLFYTGRYMARRVGSEIFLDPDDPAASSGKQVILRNSALCGRCGDTLHSISPRDYVICSCKEISIDGGYETLRRAVRHDSEALIDTSVVHP